MPAARVLNGIHVSNHPNRFVEDMTRVTRPAGAAVVMHQLMFPTDEMTGDFGDMENDYWMKLRYGHEGQRIAPAPERLLVVRIWHDNDPFRFEPKVRAEYVVRLLERWHAHGYPDHNLLDDPFVAVQATNETNIEPASSLALPPTERYDRAARWESAFWEAFDRAAPGRRCMSCGPNLAFGHDWLPDQPDSEYEHPGIHDLCRRHVETGGLLGIHVYYHGHRPWERGGPGQENEHWFWMRPFRPEGWRDEREPDRPHDRGGVLARFPDALFAVTEAGSWRHSDPSGTAETIASFRAFLDRASETGRFVGFCPFIWDGAGHPQNVIVPNESLRSALLALPDVPAGAALPVARPGYEPAPPTPTPPTPTPPTPTPPAPTPPTPTPPAPTPPTPTPPTPTPPTPIPPTPTPPTPVPAEWQPRRTDAVLEAVEARAGEGWAALAGRAAGHPDAPYGVRRAWAVELAAANRLGADALRDPEQPRPGALYRLPATWFRPSG